MFQDREEAGQKLADRLVEFAPDHPVVLALPRGGVPVAVPVARALKAPLDLLLVRKLGMPGQPELAAGAVVDGDTAQVVFNDTLLEMSGLSRTDFDDAKAEKLKEIEDRRKLYLGGREPVPLKDCTAIVVDDGIATGATVRAALLALGQSGATRVILAVPVAPRDAIQTLAPLVDDLVCLEVPQPFIAVGVHYSRFDQVGDAEVQQIMRDHINSPRT